MIPPTIKHRGVLCIPFQNHARAAGEAHRLELLQDWVLAAGLEAGVSLTPVEGAFDSNEAIAERIYRSLAEADVVVSVVREANADVFFESGYALGCGKPVLYVAREGETIPFDIAGIERFVYEELDSTTQSRLAAALRQTIVAGQSLLTTSPEFQRARRRLMSTAFDAGLFGQCVRYLLDTTSAWISSWGDSQLEVSGAEAVTAVGTFILRNLQSGGFATQYYRGQDSWLQESSLADYFEVARAVVESQLHISRVYVLDSPEQLDDDALRARAWGDSAAGLSVAFVLMQDLPDPRAADFGLWDDSLVGDVEYSELPGQGPRLHRCRYHSSRYRLDQARSWQRSIERLAQPCPDLPSEAALLTESAPVIPVLGAAHCRDPRGKPDCSAYHLPWQLLRQCGMVSTPRWHGRFYADEFRDWSSRLDGSDPGSLDILVTGLADYGMLYWLAQSLPRAVRDRSVFHILDICQTPLEGCRWLQQRLSAIKPPLSIDVRLYRRNVFANGLDGESCDLIVSDAFLTRFEDRAQRQELVREWLRLLRRNGKIVTTARVAHGTDIGPGEREAFVQTARQRAIERGLDPSLVQEGAERYARYVTSFPFDSEDDLISVLADVTMSKGSQRVDFEVLDHMEMVPAKYGRIVLEKS